MVKGKHVAQEDGDKLTLKMAIENSLNLYGEGSSSIVELSEEIASLIAKMETLEELEVANDYFDIDEETVLNIAKYESLWSLYKVESQMTPALENTNDSDKVEGEVILRATSPIRKISMRLRER